jgi:hypothetical protein
LNECNNFHLRSAFWTLKRINLINFIDQLSPGFPACLWRRRIIQYLYLNIIFIAILYSTILSLLPSCVRLKAVIANERLIGIGNVETDPMEKLYCIQYLKITFLSHMHPGFINHRSGIFSIPDFISKKCGMNNVLYHFFYLWKETILYKPEMGIIFGSGNI